VSGLGIQVDRPCRTCATTIRYSYQLAQAGQTCCQCNQPLDPFLHDEAFRLHDSNFANSIYDRRCFWRELVPRLEQMGVRLVRA
jgi:hypothetical protein